MKLYIKQIEQVKCVNVFEGKERRKSLKHIHDFSIFVCFYCLSATIYFTLSQSLLPFSHNTFHPFLKSVPSSLNQFHPFLKSGAFQPQCIHPFLDSVAFQPQYSSAFLRVCCLPATTHFTLSLSLLPFSLSQFHPFLKSDAFQPQCLSPFLRLCCFSATIPFTLH